MKAIKITLKSNIQSLDATTGDVKLVLKSDFGEVDTRNITAKPASLEGILTLKKLATSEVKIGSRVIIHVLIEEKDDESL